ncbi:MAG: CheR family methyltransferase [Pseudomonadota bacterium]
MGVEQLDSRQLAGSEAAPMASDVNFPVVGIGASAGGFQALATLLENMPPDPGMALVVILHLAADGPSAADKVLQRATDMPVVQVSHTTRILPGKVYVIPPDRCLRMNDGHLVLDQLERRSARPVAIDIFLRTLAMAHGEHAVGVVLSGMGSDGTAGLACIKEMGGVTIAQLPADAREAAMPRSAIEAGTADFVLPAGEIPHKLVELRDMSEKIRRRGLLDSTTDPGPLFDMGVHPRAVLREVLELLRARTGHDFSHYRRPTLQRRLERRLQVRGLPDLAAYYRLLQNDADEAQVLLKDLLIGVTSFFRDREAFAALDRDVLPGLLGSLAEEQTLRAWVAACSTGEEAYTLAMLLAERVAGPEGWRRIQVFASDVDEHAIEVARAGVYPASIADNVSPEQLQRHFTRAGEGYKVRKALRDLVLFAPHNLLHDPAFSRVDLISCRNFLIYLNPEMQRHVLQQFHFALNPGGILMLGSAETADAAAHQFEPVDAVHRIYRSLPAALRTAGGVVAPPAPDIAPPQPAQAPPFARRGRLYSFAEIHVHKSAELAPPSILLDAEANIVHVSEAAARYLRPAGGEPTRELAALVAPELRLPLRAALLQAHRGGRAARTGLLRHAGQGGKEAVDIAVLPFRDQHAEGELLLVQFHVHPGEAPGAAACDDDGPLAQRLDEELRQTRRQLQDSLEQLETASGEMRVYSEEMQTTVEELRARADEAERGREALASRQLELEADNRKLRKKAEEAAKAHDDLANLVASSGVATIFLDRAMRIVRFTPRVADFFNVIPADIGRPLADITNSFDDPGLAEDAAAVFDTLQPLEREVRGKDGRDYIVRVHPYRTTTHRIDGAVMTFFDVTERKRVEAAQRESDARLAAVFESLPVGAGVFDSSGDITIHNQALHRFLPTSRMPSRDPARQARWRAWDADGRLIGPDDFPGARALRGERVVPGIEMLYTDDDGRETWTQVSSSPFLGADGTLIGEGVVVVNDIDALKRSEEALRENEGRLRELVGEFSQTVWETGADGMVATDSPSWRAYTGQTLEQWLGRGWLDAVHPDDRAFAARLWTEAVAAEAVVHTRFRVRRADGEWRLMTVRAAPLVGADGRIRKWVGLNVEVNGGEPPA